MPNRFSRVPRSIPALSRPVLVPRRRSRRRAILRRLWLVGFILATAGAAIFLTTRAGSVAVDLEGKTTEMHVRPGGPGRMTLTGTPTVVRLAGMSRVVLRGVAEPAGGTPVLSSDGSAVELEPVDGTIRIPSIPLAAKRLVSILEAGDGSIRARIEQGRDTPEPFRMRIDGLVRVNGVESRYDAAEVVVTAGTGAYELALTNIAPLVVDVRDDSGNIGVSFGRKYTPAAADRIPPCTECSCRSAILSGTVAMAGKKDLAAGDRLCVELLDGVIRASTPEGTQTGAVDVEVHGRAHDGMLGNEAGLITVLPRRFREMVMDRSPVLAVLLVAWLAWLLKVLMDFRLLPFMNQRRRLPEPYA